MGLRTHGSLKVIHVLTRSPRAANKVSAYLAKAGLQTGRQGVAGQSMKS